MNPPVSEVVAITGTPGTGKTTVAKILRERGYTVLSVNELAEKLDCIVGEDEGCKIVDVERLREKINSVLPNGIVFLEGHLSHLLNPKKVIVLRCNPLELKRRLESKGWSEEKVLENVEAELIDSILVEALELCDEVYEIDTTSLSPEEVANAIEGIVSGENVEKFRPGKIDWIAIVEDYIDELIRH